MTLRRTLSAVILILASTGGAWSSPITGNAETVVANRQARMEEFNAAMQGLGEQIMSQSPDRTIVQHNANIIRDLAKQLPAWFPAGTGPQSGIPTRAMPSIWQSPEDFAARSAALALSSQALADFASAGDMTRLMDKAVAVDAACVACHRAYQQRD
ncbi:MAG: hypothetical protein C0409_00710 [Novosphingobium sp.]|nr:hypothetical protein [Novosphingobium sp.]